MSGVCLAAVALCSATCVCGLCVVPNSSLPPLPPFPFPLPPQSSDKVSPQEAYAASTILSGSSKKLASDGLCSYLIGFSASTGTSLLDSSLALAASSSLGCNPVIDGAVVTRAQSGLESGDLPSIYGASLLLPLIAGAGKDLSVSWPSIIDEITQLVEVRALSRRHCARPLPVLLSQNLTATLIASALLRISVIYISIMCGPPPRSVGHAGLLLCLPQ